MLGVTSWLLGGIFYAFGYIIQSGLCIFMGFFPVILSSLFALTMNKQSDGNHFNNKKNKQKNCYDEIFSKGGLK